MKIDGLNVNLAMKHNGGSGVPSSKVGISVTAGSVFVRNPCLELARGQVLLRQKVPQIS